jgi:hypothetical protein
MTDRQRRVGFDWPERGRADRRMPVRMVLRLQQTIGNREVVALLTRPPAAPPTNEARSLPGAATVGRWLSAGRRLFRFPRSPDQAR